MHTLIVFGDPREMEAWLLNKAQRGARVSYVVRLMEGIAVLSCADSQVRCQVIQSKDDMRRLRGMTFDLVLEHPGFRKDSTPADWDGFVQVYLLRR